VAVLEVSAPWLTPPIAVRPGEDPPEFVRVPEPSGLRAEVVAAAVRARDHVEPGNVAVIVPRSLVEDVAAGFEAAGVEYGRATRRGLDRRIPLVPVDLAKGLELDAAVVVEPAAIVAEESPACGRSTSRSPGPRAASPSSTPARYPTPCASPPPPPPEASGGVERADRGSANGHSDGSLPGGRE